MRVEDVDLSRVHLHGASLEGAKLTDADLSGADISGHLAGLLINGVEVAPLVQAELERRFPERVKLRATDVVGLRDAWRMVEGLWEETTEVARKLPEHLQRRRVGGEWSFVETLRHLVCATDSWLSRAIRLELRPYHPWGLPWTGAGEDYARRMGIDTSAAPSLEEVLPVRRQRQQAVADELEKLSDDELLEVRAAPDDEGHPTGEHSVLDCIHVLLDEEWEHHRYAVRDLEELEAG